MSLANLVSSINTYTNTIKNYIDQRLGSSLVSEETTISAGGVLTYDLTTLLGSAHADYDKRSASVNVKVLDTDDTSPTHNFFINSEGVVTVGVDTNGQVRLHNYADQSITVHVRIDVPRLV